MPKPVIIAYVPALHAGYKRLFDKHPDATIYVFGEELISRFDQLRKELRQLKPEEVVRAIEGWGRKAEVLTPNKLSELEKAQPKVIIPNEDVSLELTEGRFNEISPETIFLRWDRRKMEAERDDVSPDAVVSAEKIDQDYIGQSIALGKKSSNLWRRMGAVVVKDGQMLVSAYNRSHPTEHTSWIDGDPRNNANRGVSIDLTTDIHAEARAITEAAKRGIALEDASMYVLDFPCPTCAKLIANSGIGKLYYAKGYSVLDGEQALKASNVELIHVTGVKPADPDPDSWVPYPEKKTK